MQARQAFGGVGMASVRVGKTSDSVSMYHVVLFAHPTVSKKGLQRRRANCLRRRRS